MRYVLRKPGHFGRSFILFATVGALAFGGSACRLGANNNEKLESLKSGMVYDEDGVLSVTVSTPALDTLINLANDSTQFPSSGNCSKEGAEIAILIDGTTASTAECENGTWSGTFDSTALSQGAHALQAKILTPEGKSQTSDEVAIAKDTNLPTLAITSPGNGSFINASSNSASFALAGTCSEDQQSISVRVDGQAPASQNGGLCNGTTWAAQISTLSLAAGTHTLEVSLTSSSGNAKTSDPILLTKDILAPTVSITSPTAGAFVTQALNTTSYAISGNCNESGRTVQVQTNGSAASSQSGGSCSGTTWSATISVTGLTDNATHTLSAVLADVAGNSTTATSVTVQKDATPPSIAISSPTAGAWINDAQKASFAVSGTCSSGDNGRTVTIQANGSNTTQSSISCGAGGTWSGTLDTTAMSDGAKTLTAILSDVAGNSTTTSGVSVTRDVAAPTVAISVPATGTYVQAHNHRSTYPVSGTCNENSQAVTLKVNGSNATSQSGGTCTSGAWTATIDVTSLTDGANHTLSATLADAAGNVGTTASSNTVTKDLSKPGQTAFARTSIATDPYTFAQAASGAPRYATVSSSTGVVIEETSTNLVQYSQELENAYWSPGAMTVSSNATTAPDGTSTAEKLQETTVASAQHWLIRDGAYTAEQPVTVSVFAKAAERSILVIQFKNSSYRHAFFDLSAGTLLTVNTGITASIVSAGNGWYRCVASFTGTESGWTRTAIGVTTADGTLNYTGTAFSGLYVWGAQVEQKSYASSYIPTGASTVTRSAETLTTPTAGVLNKNQGAVIVRAYVDGDLRSNSPPMERALWSMNSTSDAIYLYHSSSGAWILTTKNSSGTATGAGGGGTVLTKGWHTFGARWSSSGTKLWIDGNAEGTAPSAPNMPSTLASQLHFGSLPAGTLQWGQPIDYAALYQHAPTDAQMATYTSTSPSGEDQRLDFTGVTFNRTSVAYHPDTGVQAASGIPRYRTLGSRTGLYMEPTTTNLVASPLGNTLTGWLAQGSPTVVSDSGALYGVGQAWRLSTQTSGRIYQDFTIPAGTTNLTLSIRARSESTACNPLVNLNANNGTAWNNSWFTMSGVTSSAYSTQSITYTNVPTDVTSIRIIIQGCNNNGVWSLVDAIQVEALGYSTTFTDGTRAMESLTLPLSGNLPASGWTVEFTAIPKRARTNIVSQGTSPAFFDIGSYFNNANFRLWAWANAGLEPNIAIFIKGQTDSSWSIAGGGLGGSSHGWYVVDSPSRIAVKGSAGNSFTVYTNGTKRGPTTITDTITSWAGTNFTLYGGDYIYDEIRVSNTARADEDLEAYTLGNTSLSWDANTTWYSPFNNTLGQ